LKQGKEYEMKMVLSAAIAAMAMAIAPCAGAAQFTSTGYIESINQRPTQYASAGATSIIFRLMWTCRGTLRELA
jgi:hypothetical protein